MEPDRTARGDVVRQLARRPLTRAELVERLERRGHARDAAEAAADEAERNGWIDDARLAYDAMVTRSGRMGKGRDRLLAELTARGVARQTAEAAWRKAVETGDLDPEAALAKAVRKRLGAGGPIDGRRWARVYNALLREGFDREEVEAALAPHRPRLDGSVEGFVERTEE